MLVVPSGVEPELWVSKTRVQPLHHGTSEIVDIISYFLHPPPGACAFDALWIVNADLPSNVRSRSGQPCSLCRAGDLRVLRPTRRIHIRRRGRVLHNSPPPASVRSAGGPDRDRAWHLWSSSLRGECPRLRYRSTRRCSRVFRSPSAS